MPSAARRHLLVANCLPLAQECGELSGDELIAAINRVEAAMKRQFAEIRWSFFEPDVDD